MTGTDVAIVGAGFAGSCVAHVLSRTGARITLIDRSAAAPDLFRAEKIEPDQAELMRRLKLLGLRAPNGPTIGVILNFSGNVLKPFDTREQYGIDYSSTIRNLRAAQPANVRFLEARVSGIEPDPVEPAVRLEDGSEVRARLVVLATGGTSEKLITSMGIARSHAPSLISLSFGFDVVREDGSPFPFAGLNYFLPPNSDRIDYITIFPIGSRMRANLFTQLKATDPSVGAIKRDTKAQLTRIFSAIVEHVGHFRVTTQVQVVPTAYYKLRAPARDGVVIVGDEFQSVSPATGKGLSKLLTDVAVLCERHVPRWLAAGRTPRSSVRAFYSDREKVRSDRDALAAWVYYHDKMRERKASLRIRILHTLKMLGLLP